MKKEKQKFVLYDILVNVEGDYLGYCFKEKFGNISHLLEEKMKVGETWICIKNKLIDCNRQVDQTFSIGDKTIIKQIFHTDKNKVFIYHTTPEGWEHCLSRENFIKYFKKDYGDNKQ